MPLRGRDEHLSLAIDRVTGIALVDRNALGRMVGVREVLRGGKVVRRCGRKTHADSSKHQRRDRGALRVDHSRSQRHLVATRLSSCRPSNRAVAWGLLAWGEWHREHSKPVLLN